MNPETFDPVSNGHSVGHWAGDALVVDTVGFSNEGITGIPGGGRRTPDSHLIERYRLLAGGKRLSVTFTWEDPKTVKARTAGCIALVYLNESFVRPVPYRDVPQAELVAIAWIIAPRVSSARTAARFS